MGQERATDASPVGSEAGRSIRPLSEIAALANYPPWFRAHPSTTVPAMLGWDRSTNLDTPRPD